MQIIFYLGSLQQDPCYRQLAFLVQGVPKFENSAFSVNLKKKNFGAPNAPSSRQINEMYFK